MEVQRWEEWKSSPSTGSSISKSMAPVYAESYKPCSVAAHKVQGSSEYGEMRLER